MLIKNQNLFHSFSAYAIIRQPCFILYNTHCQTLYLCVPDQKESFFDFRLFNHFHFLLENTRKDTEKTPAAENEEKSPEEIAESNEKIDENADILIFNKLMLWRTNFSFICIM